jgi:hypothetical protein
VAAVVLHGHALMPPDMSVFQFLPSAAFLLGIGQVVPPAQLLEQHVVELRGSRW